MKSILPDLDEKCVNILFILMFEEKEMRFTELYNEVTEAGLEMERPTLVDHLKHLTGHRLVLRRVIDVQNVTYRFNNQKYGKVREYINFSNEFINKLKENTSVFLSRPVSKQVEEVILHDTMRRLDLLKYRILFASDRKFEYGLAIKILELSGLRYYEHLLINKCLEDEQYQKEVLQEINETEKKIEG